MEWRWADARAQVADWRDRHLLAAAAAVNAVAVDAMAGVERDLDERTRGDPLDDGFDRARDRMDALIRAGCEARLGVLLDDAARELRMIDARAEGAALTLSRDGWPTLPPRSAEAPRPEAAPEPEQEPASDYLKLAWSLGRRLTLIDRALVEGARAGARATAVLGDVVRDWTGYRARVGAHARAHAAGWLFADPPERPGVLPHLEAAIDAAAASARVRLA